LKNKASKKEGVRQYHRKRQGGESPLHLGGSPRSKGEETTKDKRKIIVGIFLLGGHGDAFDSKPRKAGRAKKMGTLLNRLGIEEWDLHNRLLAELCV